MQRLSCTLVRDKFTLIYRWEQERKGTWQLSTATIGKKQTALIKTRTLPLLYLTSCSSTGFACMAFGHWCQMKRQQLTGKNSLSLHKEHSKCPASWWWEALRSVTQSLFCHLLGWSRFRLPSNLSSQNTPGEEFTKELLFWFPFP